MYRKTVLENGVRIISERLDYFRSVSLGIWVNAGSREEIPEENGISHFIEHMIFKGTENRNAFQIAKQLDAIGGMSNAFTGKEYTCFHSKVLDKHFPDLAEILTDIFLNSVFDPSEMDRERQVILQEIGMVEDTPDEQVHELFSRFFWMDHPLGRSILGTNNSVAALNKDSILDYMSRFYTPDRIIIAATGNLDHDDLVEYFKPMFKSLKNKGFEAGHGIPDTHFGISCNYKELEQVHICLGGKAPHLSSEKRFASALLNTILGGNMSSRLFQEIREKRGLAYSVFSFLSAYRDTGLMCIYVATTPSEVNQVLELIDIENRKLKKGEISEKDLSEAKENLIGGILLSSEGTDSRMLRIAKNEYIFGRNMDYDEIVANVEKVTLDEVIEIAGEIFGKGDLSLTTLGPIKEENLNLSWL